MTLSNIDTNILSLAEAILFISIGVLLRRFKRIKSGRRKSLLEDIVKGIEIVIYIFFISSIPSKNIELWFNLFWIIVGLHVNEIYIPLKEEALKLINAYIPVFSPKRKSSKEKKKILQKKILALTKKLNNAKDRTLVN